MRHAKSDWNAEYSSDFERPLKKRGKKDAEKMGKFLKNLGIVPDLILSSPAKRAKKTAKLFVKGSEYQKDIVFVDDFYMGSCNIFFNTIMTTPEQVEYLMLVGHNFAIEEMATLLNNDRYLSMPTATIAVFEVDADLWNNFSIKNCNLLHYLKPKEL
jgi:phosphohistidine phosphatase